MKALLIFACILHSSLSLDNGLGRTPQMGWNSWNHFGCSVSAQLVMETADAMVSEVMPRDLLPILFSRTHRSVRD